VRTLSVALVFLVAAATTGRADWTIQSAQTEGARDGVEHRHIVLTDPEASSNATVDLAIFSTKSCTLRVIQNEDGASNLAEVMTRRKCLAGVNGGYFSPDFAPIGLLITDGNVVAPLQRARLITGVLSASTHGVQITRVREFSQQRKVNAAVQCGPFLVDLGQRARGLDNSRSARRTFAAIDGSDRAALGFCSEITLLELAKILATEQLAEDFKILRALNLDGGSSSAFWFRRETSHAFSISEQKTVRDFVAVVPRGSGD